MLLLLPCLLLLLWDPSLPSRGVGWSRLVLRKGRWVVVEGIPVELFRLGVGRRRKEDGRLREEEKELVKGKGRVVRPSGRESLEEKLQRLHLEILQSIESQKETCSHRPKERVEGGGDSQASSTRFAFPPWLSPPPVTPPSWSHVYPFTSSTTPPFATPPSNSHTSTRIYSFYLVHSPAFFLSSPHRPLSSPPQRSSSTFPPLTRSSPSQVKKNKGLQA